MVATNGSLVHRRVPDDLEGFQFELINLSVPQLVEILDAERHRKWNRPRGDLRQWSRLLLHLHGVLDSLLKKHEKGDDFKQYVLIERVPECELCSVIEFYAYLVEHCTSRSVVQEDAHRIADALGCLNLGVKLSAMHFFAEYAPWLKRDDTKRRVARHISLWMTAVPTRDLVGFVDQENKEPDTAYKLPGFAFKPPRTIPTAKKFKYIDDVRVSLMLQKMKPVDGLMVDNAEAMRAVVQYYVQLSSSSRERRIQLVELQALALAASSEILKHLEFIDAVVDFDAPWQSIANVARAYTRVPAALRAKMLRVLDIFFRMLARDNQSASKYLVTLGFAEMIPGVFARAADSGNYDEPAQLFYCLSYMSGRRLVSSGMIPALMDLIDSAPRDSRLLKAKCAILELLHNVSIDVSSVVDMVFTPHEAMSRFSKSLSQELENAENAVESKPDYCGVNYSISYYRALFIKSLLVMFTNMLSYRYSSEMLVELVESPLLGLLTRIIASMSEMLGSRITCFACQILARLDDVEPVLLPRLEKENLLPRLIDALPLLTGLSADYVEASALLLSALRDAVDETTKKAYLRALISHLEKSEFEDDSIWAYPLPPTYFEFVDDLSWVVGYIERISLKFVKWDLALAQQKYLMPWPGPTSTGHLRPDNYKPSVLPNLRKKYSLPDSADLRPIAQTQRLKQTAKVDLHDTATYTLRALLHYLNELIAHPPVMDMLMNSGDLARKNVFRSVMQLRMTPAAKETNSSVTTLDTDEHAYVSNSERLDVLTELNAEAVAADLLPETRQNAYFYQSKTSTPATLRAILGFRLLYCEVADCGGKVPQRFNATVTRPISVLQNATLVAENIELAKSLCKYWEEIVDDAPKGPQGTTWQAEAIKFHNTVYDLLAKRLDSVIDLGEEERRQLWVLFEYLATLVKTCPSEILEDVWDHMFAHKTAPILFVALTLTAIVESTPPPALQLTDSDPSKELWLITPEKLLRPAFNYYVRSTSQESASKLAGAFGGILSSMGGLPANILEDIWQDSTLMRPVVREAMKQLYSKSRLPGRAVLNIVKCIHDEFNDYDPELPDCIGDRKKFKRRMFAIYGDDFATRESILVVGQLFDMKVDGWCNDVDARAYAHKLAQRIEQWIEPESRYDIEVGPLRYIAALFESLRSTLCYITRQFKAVENTGRDFKAQFPASALGLFPKLASIAMNRYLGEIRLPFRKKREEQRTLWDYLSEVAAAIAPISTETRRAVVASHLLSCLIQRHGSYKAINAEDFLGVAIHSIVEAVVLDDATLAKIATASFDIQPILGKALGEMPETTFVRTDVVARVALSGKLEIRFTRQMDTCAKLAQSPDMRPYNRLPDAEMQVVMSELSRDAFNAFGPDGSYRGTDDNSIRLYALTNATKMSLAARGALLSLKDHVPVLVKFYLNTASYILNKQAEDGQVPRPPHDFETGGALDEAMTMSGPERQSLFESIKNHLRLTCPVRSGYIGAAGVLVNMATPISFKYLPDSHERWESHRITARAVFESLASEIKKATKLPADQWNGSIVNMLHATVDLLRSILALCNRQEYRMSHRALTEMKKVLIETDLWEVVADAVKRSDPDLPQTAQAWLCLVDLINEHRVFFWGEPDQTSGESESIDGRTDGDAEDMADGFTDEESVFRHSALAQLESDDGDSSEQEDAMELEEIADHASDDEPASEYDESSDDSAPEVMSIDIEDVENSEADSWETTSQTSQMEDVLDEPNQDIPETYSDSEIEVAAQFMARGLLNAIRRGNEEDGPESTTGDSDGESDTNTDDDRPWLSVLRNAVEAAGISGEQAGVPNSHRENLRLLLELTEVGNHGPEDVKNENQVSLKWGNACGLWKYLKFDGPEDVGAFTEQFKYTWYDSHRRAEEMEETLATHFKDTKSAYLVSGAEWIHAAECHVPMQCAVTSSAATKVAMLDVLLSGLKNNTVGMSGCDHLLAALFSASDHVKNGHEYVMRSCFDLCKTTMVPAQSSDTLTKNGIVIIRALACLRRMMETRPSSARWFISRGHSSERLATMLGMFTWLLNMDLFTTVGEAVCGADQIIRTLGPQVEKSSAAKLLAPFVEILIKSMHSSNCTSRVFKRVTSRLSKLNPGPMIVADAKTVVAAISDDFDGNKGQLAHDQAALLRLMTALETIYGNSDMLCTFYARLELFPLWERLHKCLSTKDPQDMTLLPLVEMLALVVLSTDKAKENNEFARRTKEFMLGFGKQHRGVINQVIRHNLRLLRGSLGILARDHHILDFDIKQAHFHRLLAQKSRSSPDPDATLFLTVHRDSIFNDSFEPLITLFYGEEEDLAELTSPKFAVEFVGEDAIDDGGVAREWLDLICKELMSPTLDLFVPTVPGAAVYQLNPHSVDHNSINYFVFAGMVLGRAMLDKRPVGIYFSRAVYKALLKRKVTLDDMEAVDENYYKSLKWMLENDITDVISETFTSTSLNSEGTSITVELIPGGSSVAVTEENKHEYVRLVVDWRLVRSVQEQTSAFVNGFQEFIPEEMIEYFDENDLELLICGLPTIDVADWRRNTEYKNYTASSPQIKWFWNIVENTFGQEERAKLLQFATGTSRVPALGFAHLESAGGPGRFSIEREFGSTDRLPSAHTCSNQLVLPAYESKEQLEKLLFKAVNEGATGFGFI